MLTNIEEVRERFPHLIINEQAEKKFDQIFETLPGHPQADEVFASLEEKLQYLDDFHKNNVQVELGHDFANLSFSVTWSERTEGGNYKPKMWGGLQCNAVRQTLPASVQFGEPQWWSVNT
jgi:hypothetical protein